MQNSLNKEPAWDIFVFQISFLFHNQQNTSTKGTSHASEFALEESHDIKKQPAPIIESHNAQ